MVDVVDGRIVQEGWMVVSQRGNVVFIEMMVASGA